MRYFYVLRDDYDDQDVLAFNFTQLREDLVRFARRFQPRVLREAREYRECVERQIAVRRMDPVLRDIYMPGLRAQIMAARPFLDWLRKEVGEPQPRGPRATFTILDEASGFGGIPVVETDLVPEGQAFLINPDYIEWHDEGGEG